MAFPDFKNWRFNPFSGVFNPVPISGELHNIVFDEAANAFGIRLFEGVELKNPSTVIIVENVTGGTVFSEVPRTTAPSTGQFRVDYLADTFFGTSFIEFNSADNGTQVTVSYDGLGTNVKDRYQLLQATIIPTNLGVEGNVQITDNIALDGVVNAPWDFGDEVVTNPKDPDPSVGGNEIGDRDFNDKRYGTRDFDYDFEFTDLWVLTGAVVFNETAGVNSKRALRFTGDGTTNTATFSNTDGTKKFFPIIETGSVNGIIRAKRSAGYDGDIRILIDFFDKDKVLILGKLSTITNTMLLTTYKEFSFGVPENATVNAAFYTINFRNTSIATTGTCDIDFWRIGNNIGISDEFLNDTLGSTGRGSYGGNGGLAFSGKGFIEMRLDSLDNGYTDVGTIGAATFLTREFEIDGTEFLQRQITDVLLEFQAFSAPTSVGFVQNGRAGIINFSIPQFSQGTRDVIIPVFNFNTTNRKSRIRLTVNNATGSSGPFSIIFIARILIMS